MVQTRLSKDNIDDDDETAKDEHVDGNEGDESKSKKDDDNANENDFYEYEMILQLKLAHLAVLGKFFG